MEDSLTLGERPDIAEALGVDSATVIDNGQFRAVLQVETRRDGFIHGKGIAFTPKTEAALAERVARWANGNR